jgi:hypothetical protein
MNHDSSPSTYAIYRQTPESCLTTRHVLALQPLALEYKDLRPTFPHLHTFKVMARSFINKMQGFITLHEQ